MSPSESRSARHAEILEGSVLVLLIVLTEIAFLNTYWVFDDAYFFIRYANNILGGFGYTWNAGSAPVDGITSPLWLGLVTVAMAIFRPDYPSYSVLLGQLSNLAALTLLVALFGCVRSVLPVERKHWALVPSAYLTLMTFSIGTVVNTGMETALAGVLVVLYVTALARLAWRAPDNPPSPWKALGVGAFALVLLLTRPELGLLALGAPGLLMLAHARTDRRRALFFLGCAALGSVLIVAYLAVRLKMFGEVPPLAFHVKGSYWNSPYKDYNVEVLNTLGLLPLWYWRDTMAIHAVVLYSLIHRRQVAQLAWLWMPLYLTVLYISTTLQIMGWEHRYYFPCTCGIMMVGALCWRRQEGEEIPPVALPGRMLLHGCIGAVAAVHLMLFNLIPAGMVASKTPAVPHPRLVIAKLVHGFPAGIRVAATEVGALGAFNPHLQIVDCAGLNDPVLARGFDADVLFAKPPDMITLIHPDYGGMTEDIRRHPAFADYALARKLHWWEEDSNLDSNIWVWRKSPHYGEMVRQLKEAEAADKEKAREAAATPNPAPGN